MASIQEIKEGFNRLHCVIRSQLRWISWKENGQIVFAKVEPSRVDLEVLRVKQTEDWFSEWAKSSIRQMDYESELLSKTYSVGEQNRWT